MRMKQALNICIATHLGPGKLCSIFFLTRSFTGKEVAIADFLPNESLFGARNIIRNLPKAIDALLTSLQKIHPSKYVSCIYTYHRWRCGRKTLIYWFICSNWSGMSVQTSLNLVRSYHQKIPALIPRICTPLSVWCQKVFAMVASFENSTKATMFRLWVLPGIWWVLVSWILFVSSWWYLVLGHNIIGYAYVRGRHVLVFMTTSACWAGKTRMEHCGGCSHFWYVPLFSI